MTTASVGTCSHWPQAYRSRSRSPVLSACVQVEFAQALFVEATTGNPVMLDTRIPSQQRRQESICLRYPRRVESEGREVDALPPQSGEENAGVVAAGEGKPERATARSEVPQGRAKGRLEIGERLVVGLAPLFADQRPRIDDRSRVGLDCKRLARQETTDAAKARGRRWIPIHADRRPKRRRCIDRPYVAADESSATGNEELPIRGPPAVQTAEGSACVRPESASADENPPSAPCRRERLDLVRAGCGDLFDRCSPGGVGLHRDPEQVPGRPISVGRGADWQASLPRKVQVLSKLQRHPSRIKVSRLRTDYELAPVHAHCAVLAVGKPFARIIAVTSGSPVRVALIHPHFSRSSSLERDSVLLAAGLVSHDIEVHVYCDPSTRTADVPGVTFHDVFPTRVGRGPSSSRLGHPLERGSFAIAATRALRRDRHLYDVIDVRQTGAWEHDVVTVHGVVAAMQRRWPSEAGRSFRGNRAASLRLPSSSSLR